MDVRLQWHRITCLGYARGPESAVTSGSGCILFAQSVGRDLRIEAIICAGHCQ